MRSAIAIVVLLTACATERPPVSGPHVATGAEKVDVYGTWSHRAIVIASETPDVVVGDETASEVDVTLEEELVIAYGEGHEPWLALRVDHFDVVERTLPSGEQVAVENVERPWWERDIVRIDMSSELVGASVPTDLELEPVSYVPDSGTYESGYPERDDDDRLVWSFVSAYWVLGSPPGEVVVRHELERIEP